MFIFSLDRSQEGLISEVSALSLLRSRFGGMWKLTERFSRADRRGVDAIGVLESGKRMYVQIKSSVHMALKFIEKNSCQYNGCRVGVLVMPRDANTRSDIHWVGGQSKWQRPAHNRSRRGRVLVREWN